MHGRKFAAVIRGAHHLTHGVARPDAVEEDPRACQGLEVTSDGRSF